MSLRVGFVLLLLALFAPSLSRAYCRRSSCDGITGTRCTPADPTDCGVPLWWPSGCVTYSPWQAPTPDPAVDARHAAALEQAFARWQAADCGGGRPPRLHVTRTAAVTCREHEFHRRGGNANVIAFHSAWPYRDGHLALTVLSFGAKSGEIYDADTEFNAPLLEPGHTAGSPEPVALHEAGHFLGLAHSADPDAVMSGTFHEGRGARVTLAPDDVAAICAAFPPGPAPTCPGTPRGGLRSTCALVPWPTRVAKALLGVLSNVLATVGRGKTPHADGRL